MKPEIARTIIRKCLGHKKGESLLIVCDQKTKAIGEYFYRRASKDGIECALINFCCGLMHGQEPPNAIAQALRAVDIALLLTSSSLSHTRARKTASSLGARIASLPGISESVLNRSILLDYPALKKKVDQLARRLSRGKRLEVYSQQGTRLSMSIRGRKGFSDHGLYTRKGQFGNLPAGEACIGPCEGTTDGSLIIDASAPLVGRIKTPKRLKIKKGKVQNMPFARIASMIKPLGPAALNVAELGIGLNPKAKVSGNILEDEKVKGTAHLAIGNNISFGGMVSCPCHLDFVFFNPVILIDGKRIAL